MTTISADKVEDLIVFNSLSNKNFIPDIKDVSYMDITLLGLIKGSPVYESGIKRSVEYFDEKNYQEGNLLVAVQKTFTDIRDSNGNLTGLKITLKWFDYEGNVGIEKIDTKTFKLGEAANYEKKRRQRSVDHMLAETHGTPLAPVIQNLYDYYYNKTQNVQNFDFVRSYIDLNNYQAWIDQVMLDKDDNDLSQTNPNLSTYPVKDWLNIVITVSTNHTAKLWQLLINEVYTLAKI